MSLKEDKELQARWVAEYSKQGHRLATASDL